MRNERTPASAAPNASLSFGQRIVNTVLRAVYFGRVPVIPAIGTVPVEPIGPGAHARLILSSHRNGAIDGHQVLAAFPRAQFLISIQLVRNRFMRLFFSGIPVVRPKDIERYGLDPASVANPVEAACAHLRHGGELGIFPEGSSEWEHRPQPYKRGAARIACTLIDEGIDLEVVPLGLFYSNPDRFRSRAEVVVGEPITIPAREGKDLRTWEAEVATVLALALDEVSVNCPDEAAFENIQAQALHTARTDAQVSFAERFLELQNAVGSAAGPESTTRTGQAPRRRSDFPLVRWVGLALMWLFAPILALAALAGSRADGRNTVTFFRMLGGAIAAMVWIPALAVAAFFWPQVVGAGIASGVLGWLLLGVRRWRL